MKHPETTFSLQLYLLRSLLQEQRQLCRWDIRWIGRKASTYLHRVLCSSSIGIFTTFILLIHCSRNRLKPFHGHKLPLTWKHKEEERIDTWLEGHRKSIFSCNITVTFAYFMLISLLAHTQGKIRAKQKLVLLGKSTTAHTCSSHLIIHWFTKGKALREKSTKQLSLLWRKPACLHHILAHPGWCAQRRRLPYIPPVLVFWHLLSCSNKE